MKGLNKAFMENPALFLASRPLQIQDRLGNYNSPGTPLTAINPNANPPIFDFDLRPVGTACELELFQDHDKTHTFGKQRPIRAYWLEYEFGKVWTIGGNMNQADYMFTPMLDGCYVGANATGMVHVPGSMKKSSDLMTMRGYATKAIGTPLLGFHSDAGDATEMTLIGVRESTGWVFYVQGHNKFGTGAPALENVFNTSATVIRVNDPATYG